MLRVALHTQWDLALLLPRQIPGLKPGRERWAITTDATQAQTRWRCLRDLDGEQRLRRMGRTEIEENVPTLAPVLCGPLDIGLAIEPTTTLANASAVPDLVEQGKDQIYLAVAGRETAARHTGRALVTRVPALTTCIDGQRTNAVHRIMPLHDSAGPNVIKEVAHALKQQWRMYERNVGTEIFCYCIALCAGPAFDGRAVPVTAEPELATRAVKLGREVAYVQSGPVKRGAARWMNGPPKGPILGARITCDVDNGELRVGARNAQRLANVNENVATAQLGDTPVIARWWGRRTAKRGLRPLALGDHSGRADEWTTTLAEELGRVVWRVQAWVVLEDGLAELANEMTVEEDFRRTQRVYHSLPGREAETEAGGERKRIEQYEERHARSAHHRRVGPRQARRARVPFDVSRSRSHATTKPPRRTPQPKCCARQRRNCGNGVTMTPGDPDTVPVSWAAPCNDTTAMPFTRTDGAWRVPSLFGEISVEAVGKLTRTLSDVPSDVTRGTRKCSGKNIGARVDDQHDDNVEVNASEAAEAMTKRSAWCRQQHAERACQKRERANRWTMIVVGGAEHAEPPADKRGWCYAESSQRGATMAAGQDRPRKCKAEGVGGKGGAENAVGSGVASPAHRAGATPRRERCTITKVAKTKDPWDSCNG